MLPKIYIDGKDGTTGLQIYERLGQRRDVELLLIDEDKRKDTTERRRLLNAADLVFLCLPDAAAIEAVSLIENPGTRVIDASTAHRTAPGWVYGFPELSGQRRQAIAAAKRVANPGCHASGFVACVAPLRAAGLLPATTALTCFSLTGYSGGGKKMIAEYEDASRPAALDAPRIYGLNLRHKHLPEMQLVCDLALPPIFSPILGDYEKGMTTSVPLHSSLLPGKPSAKVIHDCLATHYAGQRLVRVLPLGTESSMLSGNSLAGRDSMEMAVCGHEEQILIVATFDNLGKGASGAAVQNMNLMLGMEETAGLLL